MMKKSPVRKLGLACLLCLAGHHINLQSVPEFDFAVVKKVTNFSDAVVKQMGATYSYWEGGTEIDWGRYYHVFPNLIKIHGLKIGCEIGVSSGGHSERILQTTDVEKLYSVDPYVPNHMACLGNQLGSFTQEQFNKLYDIWYCRVTKRLKKFGNRSEVIRTFSADASLIFQDSSLDFVFIDGNHDYEYVKQDLELWYDKVRAGGLVAGDDYNMIGVERAVNEFCKTRGLSFTQDKQQPRVWWIIKP